MGANTAVSAEAGGEGAKAECRHAGGVERDPLHRARGMRVADAAQGFSALADGLLVVSSLHATLSVRDHS